MATNTTGPDEPSRAGEDAPGGRAAPPGFHYNAAGKLVPNKGRRLNVGKEGYEGPGRTDENQLGKDVAGQDIPQAFINKLEEAGLYIDPETNSLTVLDPSIMGDLQAFVESVSGKKLTEEERKKLTPKQKAILEKLEAKVMKTYQKNAGGGGLTKENLALMQVAYNRFGLTNNAYNTALVAKTKDGGSVNLTTGQTDSGSYLSDEELALLQMRSGYDADVAFQQFVEANTWNLPGGGTYSSYIAQDQERWAEWVTKNREIRMAVPEYTGRTSETTATPEAGPSFAGGFDFDTVGTPELQTASTSLQQMLAARQARETATRTDTGNSFFEDELLFPQDEG